MTLQELLCESLVQQVKTLSLTVDSMVAQIRSQAVPCPHPNDQVVTVGTMGHTSAFCKACQQELPGSLPDNPGGLT